MVGYDANPLINIYAKETLVGTLVFESANNCRFTYDEQWRLEGYPISPHIPLSGDIHSGAVLNFIRNLFPEGNALDILLETECISKNNIYAILKAIGCDTAGVLTFSDAGFAGQTDKLRPIKDDELVQRLDSGFNMVVWDDKYRLSVAGIQDKLNVYIDASGKMFLADGKYASSHILKFSPQRFKTVVVNELFCMRLALAIGIDVAEVEHKRIGEHSILVVKRFDRRVSAYGVEKRHMIDGCQALNLPPDFKYEQNFGDNRDVAHIREGVSVKDIFGFADQCTVPARARQSILDWVLFNLIIGNSDAHGKNISFFISKNKVNVAPFYDLVSVVFEATRQKKLNTNSAMAIGDNFDINDISAYDLLVMAESCGVKSDFLKRRLSKMIAKLREVLPIITFAEDGLTNSQLEIIESLKEMIEHRCGLFACQNEMLLKVSHSMG